MGRRYTDSLCSIQQLHRHDDTSVTIIPDTQELNNDELQLFYSENQEYAALVEEHSLLDDDISEKEREVFDDHTDVNSVVMPHILTRSHSNNEWTEVVIPKKGAKKQILTLSHGEINDPTMTMLKKGANIDTLLFVQA
ncbi:hypothetical protein IFM89_014676 [Coptis chinensis]|uniref:Uncharacterized protein n=1 Tax=Coptis chinensis TaxID=261450 RepID=A0A835LMZ6_9MAGN|nr:hypothetical protein IFM89_014676 [Coptis chinensis]